MTPVLALTQIGPHLLHPVAATFILAAALEHGEHVQKQGRGPGSLEPEETAGLDYHVLTGDKIRTILPWLWDFYQSADLLGLVQPHIPENVRPVGEADAKWGINVNVVHGQGGRYEKHVDEQPYTVMFYPHDLDHGDGGGLELELEGRAVVYQPRKYGLVVFDGTKIPHAVQPLVRPAVRVSVPMHFVPLTFQGRAESADAYLYERTGP